VPTAADGILNQLDEPADNTGMSRRPPSQLLGPEDDIDASVPVERSYVIATTPRSGSNLLCDHLVSTGVLGMPTEYLEMNVAAAYLAERWNVSNLGEYLKALHEHRTGHNGVFANKMHWRQVATMAKQIGVAPPGGELTIEHHIASMQLLFPGASYVYLRRADLAGQSVSLFKAFATGQWSSYWDAQAPPPAYDFEEILRHYRSLVWEEASWNRYFELAGVSPLRLEYGEVVSDPQAVAQAVADHVGVADPLPTLGSPELRKQRSAWNAETKQRFLSDLTNRGVSVDDQEAILLLAG
jgi:LPS sulfotransferase NodH